MTDKQSFLDKLSSALIERGISDADIAPYLERFDRFYDRMVSDNAATSRALENVDGIADNIAAQISDRYDEMNRLAERTMTMSVVDASGGNVAPETVYEPLVEDNSENDFDDQPTAEADIVEIDEKLKEAEPRRTEQAYMPSESADGDYFEEPDALSDDISSEQSAPLRLPDYIEEEPLKNTGKFYAIFFGTLPITVALGLVLFAAFAGVWVALGAAIGLLVAVLVGVSAIGSAVSLVGIVYGIIRLFDKPSIGIYEIGLGVLTAGAAMLVGILVYNAAIRLLPYTIKQVYKLFKFVLKKLKMLFVYVRKECSKL